MMSHGWWVRAVLATSVCASLSPMPASAHDIPPDRPIPGYVKVGPDSVQLLVRIALDTRPLPLPATDGRIDVDASLPRLHDALLKFSDAVRLFEGRSNSPACETRTPVVVAVGWIVDGYASASAHLENAAPAASAIYANQGFLDARLTYRIAPGGVMLSIQSRLTETWGRAPKLSLTFPIEGVSAGTPSTARRGECVDPDIRGGPALFCGGWMIVLEPAEHLMLLICLIVPRRTPRDIALVVVPAVVGTQRRRSCPGWL